MKKKSVCYFCGSSLMVKHYVANVDIVSSNLICRSIFKVVFSNKKLALKSYWCWFKSNGFLRGSLV